MLQIKNISKTYRTGDLVQTALDDVSLSFRDNEFVAILGPSGSGKTTLLNIIGGLDRYDDGDLLINGISTKNYTDRDWDTYRNHSIGFVFQSYNLIPHQSVLANVELALTISGISKSDRRKRAKEALEKVGLGEQIHKKPNQMSGGQMQRVAIARALVNNPDILLADEPTGALDTQTGIQVMELLKEVAKDRLVIMVTHNPELAEQYATRIVRVKDGHLLSDSDPVREEEMSTQSGTKPSKKASMSLGTALSLSANNLRTKKGRTLMTALAGSIGIIGIALILALSSGVNQYIDDLQKDTMASYPIEIDSQTMDISSMMSSRREMMTSNLSGEDSTSSSDDTILYTDSSSLTAEQSMSVNMIENNLTAFKAYLDDPDSEIQQYLGDGGVVYGYDTKFDVYVETGSGTYLNTSRDLEESSGNTVFSGMAGMSMFSTESSDGAVNFEQLMSGSDDQLVSTVVTDSYDLLYGAWPSSADEVVLVLDENNAVSTDVLYQLGMITEEEYISIKEQVASGEEVIDELGIEFENVVGQTFSLVTFSDYFTENENGTFDDISGSTIELNEMLKESGYTLTISGIIRQNDSAATTISAAIGYTSALTDYIIDHTAASAVVTAQEASPEVDVLTGRSFEEPDEAGKAAEAAEYLSELNISDKASMYQMILYLQSSATASSETTDAEDTESTEMQDASTISMSQMTMDESTLAGMLDQWLANDPDSEILLMIYDQYLTTTTYDENMSKFGLISYDAPSSISIYTDSFEAKEGVSAAIDNYNSTVSEEEQITYTDYVALLTSSMTSIINIISYVLIAFVAVSLVVSCIMISIITQISVMERTKEIGILRAIGASKRNISQVFNAETFIIGAGSGLIGILISELLIIPINAIIQGLIGSSSVSASLPASYAVILILISIVITVFSGLIPAGRAARKDPVTALRTE